MKRPSKNIVVFVDGTWEDGTGAEKTNVAKLFEYTLANSEQVTYYIPGIGTDQKRSRQRLAKDATTNRLEVQQQARSGWLASSWFPRKMLGGAHGLGMAARIREAYAFICDEYDYTCGDKIFIFGFSRGAFAARSLCGFLEKVGTLLKDKLHLVPQAYQIYEGTRDPGAERLNAYLIPFTGGTVKTNEGPPAVKIHFVGVWDTVAALGIPTRLQIFKATRTEYHQTRVPPNVIYARHAIAAHELRVEFQVLPWCAHSKGSSEGRIPALLQVWFAGAHGDVGGGYPESESGLSNEALLWMAREAKNFGLKVALALGEITQGPKSEVLHHQVKGIYWAWLPAVRKHLETLHEQLRSGLIHADVNGECNFHESLVDRLRCPQHYRFHFGVSDKLEHADELLNYTVLVSRLLFGARIEKRGVY